MQLVAVIGIALFTLSLSAVFLLILRLNPRHSSAALILLGLISMPLPWLLLAQPIAIRVVAANAVAFTLVQLYDTYLGRERGLGVPRLGQFLISSLNLFQLVARRAHLEPQVSARDNAKRLFAGLAQLAIAFMALAGFGFIDFKEIGFVAEHCIKSVGLFVGLVGSFQSGAACMRILGYTAREPCRGPYLARTPADFWRRYNRVFGQFLYENVFRQINGGRWVTAGTLATFLVSGLFHEYVFSSALGRPMGYQMAFFALQGGAVIATMNFKPTGHLVPLSLLLTLAFNILTSVFFMITVHQFVPLYVNTPPFGN